jgi:hypothetical protein
VVLRNSWLLKVFEGYLIWIGESISSNKAEWQCSPMWSGLCHQLSCCNHLAKKKSSIVLSNHVDLK